MITIKLKYEVSQEHQFMINEYQKQYSSIFHVLYQQLSKESELKSEFSYLKSNSICIQKVKRLNNIGLMNAWFIQSAIKEAYQLVKSNKEHNYNKIVFSGKRNFIMRCKGLITRQQFLENKKLNPIYSVGNKDRHGNRFFRIFEDLEYIQFQPNNKNKIKLKIHLQNYKQILKKLYLKQQQNNIIPITYKLDQNYVYISYEEDKLYNIKYKQIQNRVLGIDMNPNYIGWSIVDWKSGSEFKIIKSGIYSIKELNDKDFSLNGKGYSNDSKERQYITNKRKYETIQIVKNIVNKAIYYKCQIVSIEDLNIKSSDKKLGKHYNKLVNNLWNRNQFANNLTKRCNIFNIKLLKVKPEYSSFIGNFLYRSLNLPDMILASIELSRRGYEFNAQYIEHTKEIKRNIIQPNINDFKHFYKKSLEEFQIKDNHLDLKELYDLFKKSKVMYRLSIDKFNLYFSRFFTPKSYMNIANFG